MSHMLISERVPLLSGALGALNSEMEKMERHNRVLTKENARLRLPTRTKAAANLRRRIAGLGQRVRKLNEENKCLSMRVPSLDRRIAEQEQRIVGLNAEIKRLQSAPKLDQKSIYFSEIAKMRDENDLLRAENQYLKCSDGAFAVGVNKIRTKLEIPTQGSAILYCLLSAPSGFLTYENLSRRVSESESLGSIRVQLSYLRKALRSRALGEVETVFGGGLRLSPEHGEAIRRFLDHGGALNIVSTTYQPAIEQETEEELAA
jgi:DNA-binding winged helix-turn-helix (wHTH) protein